MAERQAPRVALDKLAFLMAFVPYLTVQERVSVREAAQHFGYDEEFIRRSALALTVSGVAEGGLPDAHLFDIDFDALERDDELVLVTRIAIDDEVPRLSGREAAALIAGLQLLGNDPAIGGAPEYATLIGKLRRGAATEPEPTAISQPEVANFELLSTAIREGRRVAFDYRAAGSAEGQRREVEPLRIESIDADYHLRGWCRLRGAPRTFRLDRISGLELLGAGVEHDVTVIDEAGHAFLGEADDAPVTVEFDAAGEQLAAVYRPLSIELDPARGRARMRVAIAAPSTLRRLVTELPGASVIEPASARAAMRAWADDALGRYRAPAK